MDRDIALQITQKITAINTALQGIVTGTTPAADNRSVSPDPEENQRSAPTADPEEPEASEEEPEPVTKDKK